MLKFFDKKQNFFKVTRAFLASLWWTFSKVGGQMKNVNRDHLFLSLPPCNEKKNEKKILITSLVQAASKDHHYHNYRFFGSSHLQIFWYYDSNKVAIGWLKWSFCSHINHFTISLIDNSPFGKLTLLDEL